MVLTLNLSGAGLLPRRAVPSTIKALLLDCHSGEFVQRTSIQLSAPRQSAAFNPDRTDALEFGIVPVQIQQPSHQPVYQQIWIFLARGHRTRMCFQFRLSQSMPHQLSHQSLTNHFY